MVAKYNSTVRSTVPENPTLERNTQSIGQRVAQIWPSEVFQNGRRPPSWIWSNRKWRRSIRRPRKPHPRNKHEVDRIMRHRDMAIWSFSKWPPSAILDLIRPEMAPFDPPSSKTPS